MGFHAGSAKTDGDSITAFGASALRQATGNDNTAVGNNANYGITSGTNNTAVGHYSQMLHNVSNNTMIGEMCGYDTSGSQNTGLGQGAMTSCSGSNNTSIGCSASTSSGTSSNQVTLGDANVATLRCNQTSISSLSDGRDKTDVIDLPAGLDFIKSIRPVKFKWQRRVPDINDGKIRAGFIAQELQSAQVDNEYLDLVHDDNPEKLEAKQGNLIPVLVKAIQELSAKNTTLETRVATLEAA